MNEPLDFTDTAAKSVILKISFQNVSKIGKKSIYLLKLKKKHWKLGIFEGVPIINHDFIVYACLQRALKPKFTFMVHVAIVKNYG